MINREQTLNREQTREMYRFKKEVALDLFMEGLDCAYSNDTESAVDFFRQASEQEPDNPYIYNYLVMISEFNKATDEELLELCVEWSRVADNSGIESQIARSHASFKYYYATPEERLVELKKFGEELERLSKSDTK